MDALPKTAVGDFSYALRNCNICHVLHRMKNFSASDMQVRDFDHDCFRRLRGDERLKEIRFQIDPESRSNPIVDKVNISTVAKGPYGRNVRRTVL